MRKISDWDEICLLYFNCVAFIATGFGLSQDVLFYKSNLPDILSVLFFPAFWLALPFVIFRKRLSPILAPLGFITLQTGFLLILFDRIFLFRSGWVFSFTALFIFSGLAFFSAKSRQHDAVRTKMLTLSRITCGGLIIFTVFWFGRSIFRIKAPSKSNNIVMIVVDGLGANISDALKEKSLSFTRMRSNKAYTAGYFSTLYSGRKSGTTEGDNLLSLLQDNGVRTMWASFHNDGVPDAHGFGYRGLRASFVTQNYTRLAKWLGNDYNTFFYRRPGYSGKSMGSRQKWLKHQLNFPFKSAPLLDQFLINEIDHLRGANRPFFLLIHVNITPLDAPDPGLWEMRPERNAETHAWREIWNADYVYGPQHEIFIDKWRDEYLQSIVKRNQELESLQETFSSRQWDKDTLLLLTADHGKIFKDGKAWYGFHDDEEVVRVPFLVFGKGLTGIDPRLSETIDISQTILSNFKIEKKLSKNSRNLLAPQESISKFVTTLTRASTVRKEHFLSVYQEDRKYSFNLASDQIPDLTGAQFDLREIMRSYGFGASNNR